MYDLNIPEDGLYKSDSSLTVIANGKSSKTVKIPQQRGNVYAVSFVIGAPLNTSSIDYSRCRFTATNNGKSFIDDDSFLRWSELYRNDKIIIIPIKLLMGGTVPLTVDNLTAIEVSLITFPLQKLRLDPYLFLSLLPLYHVF